MLLKIEGDICKKEANYYLGNLFKIVGKFCILDGLLDLYRCKIKKMC